MYLNFFGFSEAPFNITPDTRFLYLSPQHEEALKTMLYGIKERRGFLTLTGEVGTGKTTTIRTLLNHLGPETETALILNPLLSTVELLKTINNDFGCSVSSGSPIQGELESLNRFLLETARREKNAVVIIDEAQNLSQEALEMVRLISNLETETRKLVQIVLVGQPELDAKLSRPALRQLRQRLQIRHQLRPLNLEETKKYVLFRLHQAAPKCCLVFQPGAFKKIFEYSGGIPRLINAVGELALLAAYTEETHVITPKVVRQAYKDLADKSWKKPSLWKRFLGRQETYVSST